MNGSPRSWHLFGVVALLCTRRLLADFGLLRPRPPAPPADAGAALGHWGALSFGTVAGELVLLTSSRTMLCVLTPPGPLEALVLALRAGVMEELVRLGIPPELIRREDAALAELSVCRHTDRSLLGSMNDLASHVCWFAEDELAARRAPRLDVMQAQLNETPHVRRTPAFPRGGGAVGVRARPLGVMRRDLAPYAPSRRRSRPS